MGERRATRPVSSALPSAGRRRRRSTRRRPGGRPACPPARSGSGGRSARRPPATRWPSRGLVAPTRRAAAIWMVMRLTPWATMSCSSRAMRTRSSATASWALRSSSTCMRRARWSSRPAPSEITNSGQNSGRGHPEHPEAVEQEGRAEQQEEGADRHPGRPVLVGGHRRGHRAHPAPSIRIWPNTWCTSQGDGRCPSPAAEPSRTRSQRWCVVLGPEPVGDVPAR